MQTILLYIKESENQHEFGSFAPCRLMPSYPQENAAASQSSLAQRRYRAGKPEWGAAEWGARPEALIIPARG